MRSFALALTVAAISTSAAAQATPDDPYKYFRDMTKTYEAKTNPVVPIAPQPATIQPVGPQPTRTPLLTPGNSSSGNSLLDGCVISAVGRLPKAEGLRVTNSSTEFLNSWRKFDFYNVLIQAELNGRNGSYQWTCRVYDNISAQLLEKQ